MSMIAILVATTPEQVEQLRHLADQAEVWWVHVAESPREDWVNVAEVLDLVHHTHRTLHQQFYPPAPRGRPRKKLN